MIPLTHATGEFEMVIDRTLTYFHVQGHLSKTEQGVANTALTLYDAAIIYNSTSNVSGWL